MKWHEPQLKCTNAAHCYSSATRAQCKLVQMCRAYFCCVPYGWPAEDEGSFLFLEAIGHLRYRLTFAIVNGSTMSLDRSKEITQIHVIGETWIYCSLNSTSLIRRRWCRHLNICVKVCWLMGRIFSSSSSSSSGFSHHLDSPDCHFTCVCPVRIFIPHFLHVFYTSLFTWFPVFPPVSFPGTGASNIVLSTCP